MQNINPDKRNTPKRERNRISNEKMQQEKPNRNINIKCIEVEFDIFIYLFIYLQVNLHKIMRLYCVCCRLFSIEVRMQMLEKL